MIDALKEANLRPKQAAEYLGVALSTVWLYVKQGKLPTRKLSPKVTVIKKVDLDAFINKQMMEEIQ